jgi:hypothetical protein
MAHDITYHVIDSSNIEVNRRARRARRGTLGSGQRSSLDITLAELLE